MNLYFGPLEIILRILESEIIFYIYGRYFESLQSQVFGVLAYARISRSETSLNYWSIIFAYEIKATSRHFC